MSTDFSYVNYNRNARNSDTDYCISIIFYIGKVCSRGSNITQILAQKILNDETIDYSSVYQKYINLRKERKVELPNLILIFQKVEK